jgi:hypothetical protein
MKVFATEKQAAAYAEHCRSQGKVAAIIPRNGQFLVRWTDWQRGNEQAPRGPWRDSRTPLRMPQ